MVTYSGHHIHTRYNVCRYSILDKCRDCRPVVLTLLAFHTCSEHHIPIYKCICTREVFEEPRLDKIYFVTVRWPRNQLILSISKKNLILILKCLNWLAGTNFNCHERRPNSVLLKNASDNLHSFFLIFKNSFFSFSLKNKGKRSLFLLLFANVIWYSVIRNFQLNGIYKVIFYDRFPFNFVSLFFAMSTLLFIRSADTYDM